MRLILFFISLIALADDFKFDQIYSTDLGAKDAYSKAVLFASKAKRMEIVKHEANGFIAKGILSCDLSSINTLGIEIAKDVGFTLTFQSKDKRIRIQITDMWVLSYPNNPGSLFNLAEHQQKCSKATADNFADKFDEPADNDQNW